MRDFDREFREAGYLSEASRELVPNVRNLSSAWFDLAEKANRIIQEIAIRGVETIHGTSADPKVVATFLILRSASMVQATIVLAERGMETEARTLVRSLIENALCVGALHESAERFMAMLKADADASRKAQANFILANEIIKIGSVEEIRLNDLISTFEKGVKNLSIKDIAGLSPLKLLYLTYRVISNDSAHPSAVSLQRYMNRLPDKSGWTGYLVGPASGSAIDNCLLLLVQAISAIGVAFTQMVSDTEGNRAIADLSEEWRSLSKSTCLAR